MDEPVVGSAQERPTLDKPASAPAPAPAQGGSSLMILGVAVVIVLVVIALVVFGLGGTSLLPVNYQGFDGK